MFEICLSFLTDRHTARQCRTLAALHSYLSTIGTESSSQAVASVCFYKEMASFEVQTERYKQTKKTEINPLGSYQSYES